MLQSSCRLTCSRYDIRINLLLFFVRKLFSTSNLKTDKSQGIASDVEWGWEKGNHHNIIFLENTRKNEKNMIYHVIWLITGRKRKSELYDVKWFIEYANIDDQVGILNIPLESRSN